MKIYTIYCNNKLKDDRFIVLNEEFSFIAMFFNIFWALYYKMWKLLIVTLVIIITLFTLLQSKLIVLIAISLIFGFFAEFFREYDLQNSNYKIADIILASSKEEALSKCLSRLESLD
jgi:hypothetical protein